MRLAQQKAGTLVLHADVHRRYALFADKQVGLRCTMTLPLYFRDQFTSAGINLDVAR